MSLKKEDLSYGLTITKVGHHSSIISMRTLGGCFRVFPTVQCSTVLSKPLFSYSERLWGRTIDRCIVPTLWGSSEYCQVHITSNPENVGIRRSRKVTA